MHITFVIISKINCFNNTFFLFRRTEEKGSTLRCYDDASLFHASPFDGFHWIMGPLDDESFCIDWSNLYLCFFEGSNQTCLNLLRSASNFRWTLHRAQCTLSKIFFFRNGQAIKNTIHLSHFDVKIVFKLHFTAKWACLFENIRWEKVWKINF